MVGDTPGLQVQAVAAEAKGFLSSERIVFPKDAFLPPVPSEDPAKEFKMMTVVGFDYTDRHLMNPVDGLKEIPEELFELLRELVHEGNLKVQGVHLH